jgi:hypothetical protein
MAGEKPQRVSIGFLGTQVLVARVGPDELARLRGALTAGGWHDLTTEEGTVALDLGKVVYVQVDHEGTRVGFGS